MANISEVIASFSGDEESSAGNAFVTADAFVHKWWKMNRNGSPPRPTMTCMKSALFEEDYLERVHLTPQLADALQVPL